MRAALQETEGEDEGEGRKERRGHMLVLCLDVRSVSCLLVTVSLPCGCLVETTNGSNRRKMILEKCSPYEMQKDRIRPAEPHRPPADKSSYPATAQSCILF